MFGSGFSDLLSRVLSSLRLIIPHFLGRIFPSVLPSDPRIMSLFILADGNRNYFRPHINTKYVHSNLLKCSFPCFGEFSHMHVFISVLQNIQKVPFGDLWSSLSAQPSPLWYSVLQTLADITSPDSQHHHA